jgi:hypothetical protein
MTNFVSSQNVFARITLGAALSVCAWLGAVNAGDLDSDQLPRLASHEATYDLSLIRAAQMEGVRAVSGTMRYALVDQCDGYTIETDVDISFTFSNGLSSRVVKRYAGWESKDGRRSTFRMHVYENDESEDAYTGHVTLDADGSGRATYVSTDSITFDLPPGTVLSTRQTREMLAAGQAGASLVAHTVMDGSFEDGPYRTSGFVAPARDAAADITQLPKVTLLEGAYWPVSLAYFPLGKEEETPEYEMNLHILGNGVTRAMTQDYGAYTLAVQLTGIKPREGGCQ